ncbi:MAG: alpha/beta hydrolase [Verrucomicrobiales bacterium]|nr:alpha/beta hydrolase [Verrucomicrobiales bacterium]
MMNPSYATACATLLVLLTTVLPATAKPTSENEGRIKAYLKRFPNADSDKNGVLTLSELRNHYENTRQKSNSEKEPNQEKKDKPGLKANIRYSSAHKRNVLDFYPSRSSKKGKPAPLFVWFHGGGFRQGDKASIGRGGGKMLKAYQQAGYAVASCNYPFLDIRKGMGYLQIMGHCGRAMQFIRSMAGEWGIDPNKICVGGASAGALISEWLAYSDDLAKPDSKDAVEKLSSRPNVAISHLQPLGTDMLAEPFMDRGEAPLFIYSNAPSSDRLHHPKYAELIRDRARQLKIPCVAVGGGRNNLPKPAEGKTWLSLQLEFCAKHLGLEQ